MEADAIEELAFSMFASFSYKREADLRLWWERSHESTRRNFRAEARKAIARFSLSGLEIRPKSKSTKKGKSK